MFSVIQTKIKKDDDFPDRYYNLFIYKKILDGTLYQCFEHAYHEEYILTGGGEKYISEADRAPCINSGLNLMRSVVEQSVGFLFGEDRFPGFLCEDDATKEFINDVIEDTHLVRVMQDAVTKGSIGSVAILLKVLSDRFFPVVFDTVFLTPTFDPKAPDTLIAVQEKRKVYGRELAAAGYPIDTVDHATQFWFQRNWDSREEVWWMPWKVVEEQINKDFKMQRDDKRSVTHNLGIVPWIWVRNLVGADDDVDGRCTFEPAIENCIQIDYAMSRADRALKYNADPLTVLKMRNPEEISDFIRTSQNAIILPVEGDAKILEVSGDAADAILKTVDELRDEAMQSIHGTRADPDKLATSQSSVAQRMLYLPMVQLASHLRISYGDCGLVPLIKMMMQIAASKKSIRVLGKVVTDVDPSQTITLAWNDFFPPTPFDQQLVAGTLVALTTAGIMSKKTALENLRKYFDIDDLDAEIAQIAQEQTDDDQREITKTVAMQPPKIAATSNNSK